MEKVISNVKVYDLEETLVASGYAMINQYDETTVKTQAEVLKLEQLEGELEEDRHYKRALKLTKAPLNSGHVSWAKGVVVNMDITFTNKAWWIFLPEVRLIRIRGYIWYCNPSPSLGR